ncbi:hypothetical protein U1Q18_015866 [Sarracenia purpurea var. burkii]
MKSLEWSLMLFFLVSIFPSVISQCSIAAQKGLIAKTCKETPHYKLCQSTLQAGPQNLKANLRGLTLIAINAAKEKTTMIVNDMEKMIASNPRLKDPLSECRGFYKRVLSDHIPRALEALKKGDPKAAANGLSKAAAGANECQKKLIRLSKKLAEDGMSKADVEEFDKILTIKRLKEESQERWKALINIIRTLYYLFVIIRIIIKKLIR